MIEGYTFMANSTLLVLPCQCTPKEVGDFQMLKEQRARYTLR